MVICNDLSSIECVLEYNNLILYKLLVLGLLFIYSLYVIYKHKETNWLDLKNQLSNFNFFKNFFSYIMASFYVYLIPFILILLRPSITFEMFFNYIIIGYILLLVLVIGLSVLFLEKFVTGMFGVQNRNMLKERIKYGKKN